MRAPDGLIAEIEASQVEESALMASIVLFGLARASASARPRKPTPIRDTR